MRLTGERRALAAAVLALYGLLYLLLTLTPPGPAWARALGAMAGVYGVAFVGVVAGYFWARWFAIGLGLSGVVTAATGIWQMGPEPLIVFWGATHGLVSLSLWGDGMARGFDGRTEWRARFHLDENAVHRLGRSVIRIGMSLPYILLYALAPRARGLDEALLATGAMGLAVAGLWGLLRLRTWGVFAVAGAAALLLPGLGEHAVASTGVTGVHLGACAVMGVVLLIAAAAPFARPALDFLRRR